MLRCLAPALMLIAAAVTGSAAAAAGVCARSGFDISCDDGRRGVLSGDSIIWTDGTRSSRVTQHPDVIIGNKSSVQVGPGVFVGQGKGKGSIPLDNPNAPNKLKCAILEGVSYCD